MFFALIQEIMERVRLKRDRFDCLRARGRTRIHICLSIMDGDERDSIMRVTVV